MEIEYFRSGEEFRAWLREHHADRAELWVGFHRKGSGTPSITYAEALDEALCFGWIDGVRRKVDDQRYTNRFTPRKPKSNWSAVNVRRVRELIDAGRMAPAGLKAFEARDPGNPEGILAPGRTHALDPAYEERFRANAAAWEFFQAQPPGWRRNAVGWVMSAKQEETRLRRLETLIRNAAEGIRSVM